MESVVQRKAQGTRWKDQHEIREVAWVLHINPASQHRGAEAASWTDLVCPRAKALAGWWANAARLAQLHLVVFINARRSRASAAQHGTAMTWFSWKEWTRRVAYKMSVEAMCRYTRRGQSGEALS